MKLKLTLLGGLVLAVVIYLFSSWAPPRPAGDPRPESPPPASSQQAPVPVPQGAAPPASLPGSLPASGEGKWSDTRPAVNLEHIFEGEVNRRGKPVGFHSRPAGRDPRNARVVRVVDRPNRAGVYTAEVEIRSGDGWRSKRSTFYPDRMDRAAVVQAILNAFQNRATGGSEKFRGPSGEGFDIEGRPLDGGDINTAYPLFDPGE